MEIEEEEMISRNHMQKASIEKNDAKVAYMDLLPDAILFLIISLLTTRDAVRTCVLAKRWKLLSSSLPNLDFDWPNIFEIGYPFMCADTNHKRNKHLFVKIVDQLLNNYAGTDVLTFRISFCLGREFSSEIDQWISFAVRLGVENLKLHFSCDEFLYHKDASWKPVKEKFKEYYIFPCHLVRHGKESKLKQLFLQSCIVGPDLNDRFSSLVTLELYDVPLAQSDAERIMSSCLNLESLNLEWCRHLDRLNVNSLHRLKSLVVFYCSEVKEIEISAANLTTFEFAGTNRANFSFLKVPNLEKVQFWVKDDSVLGYIFGHLVKAAPHVNTFTVFSSSDWLGRIPDCLTTFSKVKTLELYSDGRSVLHAPKIFALLEACPLLEKLSLVL